MNWTWLRNGEYALKAVPYYITKNFTLDGWLYAAFHVKQHLGNFMDSARAKQACITHSEAK